MPKEEALAPLSWTCWIFDMDGTLTLPQHDFLGIRRRLGAPLDSDLLTWMDALPPDAQRTARQTLRDWEEEIARRARPQDDALALLRALQQRGCRLGVLTRNTRAHADLTLQAAGLGAFFPPEHILGRDCAPPKPDPAGLQLLLGRLEASPSESVMVGDWTYDIEAGLAAGMSTVLVERAGPVAGGADTAGQQSLRAALAQLRSVGERPGWADPSPAPAARLSTTSRPRLWERPSW